MLECIEKGFGCSRERYERAQGRARVCRGLLDQIIARFDFLLTPSTTGEAPKFESGTGSSIFNRAWTLLRVPCVTIPSPVKSGDLPIGIQLVGKYGADEALLYWSDWAFSILNDGSTY